MAPRAAWEFIPNNLYIYTIEVSVSECYTTVRTGIAIQ